MPQKWVEFQTPQQQREDRVIGAVKALEEMANDMGFDPEQFAYHFRSLHRTLQQGVMRAFLSLVKELDKDYQAGRYDLRNEESCKVAHKIMQALNGEIHLPFI